MNQLLGPQSRVILTSREHLAESGGIFGCHKWTQGM